MLASRTSTGRLALAAFAMILVSSAATSFRTAAERARRRTAWVTNESQRDVEEMRAIALAFDEIDAKILATKLVITDSNRANLGSELRRLENERAAVNQRFDAHLAKDRRIPSNL